MEHQTNKTDAFMKVQGIVTEDVTRDENCSHYTIKSDGTEYAVLSTGRQAIKDQLFVRKGQCMEIECSEVPENSEDKRLLFRKSKIILTEREVMEDDGRDEREAAGNTEHHQPSEE